MYFTDDSKKKETLVTPSTNLSSDSSSDSTSTYGLRSSSDFSYLGNSEENSSTDNVKF